MAVADSAFLIDLMADDAGAKAKLRELLARQEPVFLPSPALHELFYGAAMAEHPERERKRVEDVARALPPLSFDSVAARIAGTFEGEASNRGRRPDRADVQVAAIASAHGEAVLTRDRRFPRPGGLVLDLY